MRRLTEAQMQLLRDLIALEDAGYLSKGDTVLVLPGYESSEVEIPAGQYTICEDCGKSDLYARDAVWSDDGSSFCPTCRSLGGKDA